MPLWLLAVLPVSCEHRGAGTTDGLPNLESLGIKRCFEDCDTKSNPFMGDYKDEKKESNLLNSATKQWICINQQVFCLLYVCF